MGQPPLTPDPERRAGERFHGDLHGPVECDVDVRRACERWPQCLKCRYTGEDTERREAREALAGVARALPFQGGFFFTGTFRNAEITSDGAMYAFRRFCRVLAKRSSSLLAVVGVEAQQRGTPHVHALLRFSTLIPLQWREIKETWFRMWGIARCYPYDASRGAAYYITKYIVSDENLDWAILDQSIIPVKKIRGTHRKGR